MSDPTDAPDVRLVLRMKPDDTVALVTELVGNTPYIHIDLEIDDDEALVYTVVSGGGVPQDAEVIIGQLELVIEAIREAAGGDAA